MNEVPQSQSVAPALTTGATQILVSASRLATAMGLTYIGSEHILLALLDDRDGIAGQVLNRAGRDQSIRQELEAILADPLYRTSSTRIIGIDEVRHDDLGPSRKRE